MKSFLIASCILALTGCGTSAKRAQFETEVQNLRDTTIVAGTSDLLPSQGYSKDAFVMPPSFAQSVMESVKGSADPSNKVLGLTCNGTDPKYIPKQTIRLVIPNPENGTPLDAAAKLRSEYVAKVREFIKHRFFSLSRQNIVKGDRQGYNQALLNDANLAFNYFSVPAKTESQLIEHFTSAVPLDSWGNFALVKQNKNSQVAYIVPNKFDETRIVKSGEDVSSRSWENSLGTITQENPSVAAMFVMSPISDQKSSGLDLFAYSDMHLIESLFVMVVPTEVQESMFQDGRGKSYCGTSSYCGFTVDNKFSPEKLIQDQRQLWDKYYYAFTEVSESAGENPSVINFDVSLNMNTFCKYARSASDFKSTQKVTQTGK